MVARLERRMGPSWVTFSVVSVADLPLYFSSLSSFRWNNDHAIIGVNADLAAGHRKFDLHVRLLLVEQPIECVRIYHLEDSRIEGERIDIRCLGYRHDD